MGAGHAVREQSTPAQAPPMEDSNEASSEQLRIARAEGDAYGKALQAMEKEDGAALVKSGNYVVVLVNEQAEGMYALADGGGLEWREAPEEANAHVEVAVADAGDGRFVPGLDITVTLSDGDREILSAPAPFLWHPFLHHYGFNARIPGPGPFTVKVRIEPPAYMRHDPRNGKRFGEPVEVVFADVGFEPGRKPSPDAHPRGAPTPYAG